MHARRERSASAGRNSPAAAHGTSDGAPPRASSELYAVPDGRDSASAKAAQLYPPSGVLMVIMLQLARVGLLRSRECGQRARPKFVCVAYTDRELTSADRQADHEGVSFVTPRHYMNGIVGRKSCCPKAWRNAAGQNMPYWCDPHVNATMQSQARFLPALSHASATHSKAFARGHLDWLVLVDDDSIWRPARLIEALSRLDPSEASYLGDFVDRPHTHNTLTWPPFACGGSGTILSRMAVQRTNFTSCAQQLEGQCWQSDWAIGKCVSDVGVRYERSFSCDTCRCSTNKFSMHRIMSKQLPDSFQSMMHGKCYFSQLTATCGHVARFPSQVLCTAERQAAISHGWPANICDNFEGATRDVRYSSPTAREIQEADALLASTMKTSDALNNDTAAAIHFNLSRHLPVGRNRTSVKRTAWPCAGVNVDFDRRREEKSRKVLEVRALDDINKTRAGTGNWVTSLFSQITATTPAPTGKYKEAVVLVSSSNITKGSCLLARIKALVSSRGNRDVVLFLSRAAMEAAEMTELFSSGLHAETQQSDDAVFQSFGSSSRSETSQSPRVRVIMQPDAPPKPMESFGDERTGMSKSNFIWWLATQHDYERAWHLEDDVLFTGPWRDLFDRFAQDDAQIIGRLTDVDVCDHFGWKDRCRMSGGERCEPRPLLVSLNSYRD
ncbi:hypothetical protein AB1Y20_012376 [Prymnesium parvum]|uniref:N-acetylgalactosaminide beta-1,3-galactosyltransferase n=1 Tax=Prymnesium parvum TaxID=97485 RepID=A0AB34IP89_PRYPA